MSIRPPKVKPATFAEFKKKHEIQQETLENMKIQHGIHHEKHEKHEIQLWQNMKTDMLEHQKHMKTDMLENRTIMKT